MKNKFDKYDYSGFSLKKITEPKYKHALLILYWPIYTIMFFVMERLISSDFHIISSHFDAMIPFSEYFIIPYLFWFVFWIGMLIYTFFFEVPVFKRTMHYFMLTFTLSLIIYAIYPNCQNLRPVSFANNNLFTQIVKLIYTIDTSTNVCPSMHVIGAFGVVFAAHNSKHLSKNIYEIIICLLALLISAATLFVKQHSVIDVVAAIPMCLLGYVICFRKNKTA